MARIRSIKPQFFVNEEVASLPYEWRLLFIGLWTQADRDGRLEDRPQRLKAALFPYDDLDVNDGLSSLVNVGLITRYEGNGQRLIAIPKWAKHQQPHIRESVSELPPPGESMVPALFEPVGSGKGADPDPDQGRSTGSVLARFDRFWAVYPRHVSKDAARKSWLKLAPDEALTAAIIAKVQEHAATPQWVKDNGDFIPHPRTWLNQRRWEDEPGRVVKHQPRPLWDCQHFERCPNQAVCGHKDAMPEKYPRRAKVPA